MFRVIALVAGLLFSPVTLSALPWQYELSSKNEIDREIFSAEISSHYELLGGKVRLTWHRNDVDELASLIKTELVMMGVDERNIVLDKNMAYDNSETLVTAAIERQQAPYRCNYHRQYYALQDSDTTGCALENNLSMFLLEKDRIIF